MSAIPTAQPPVNQTERHYVETIPSGSGHVVKCHTCIRSVYVEGSADYAKTVGNRHDLDDHPRPAATAALVEEADGL